MTSEPIQPERDPSDPTSLPPLFSTPPARPGRIRGGFSMRPVGDEPPAPVPLDVVRRRHAATAGAGATGASVSDHENLDWGLVAAFRTLVATRLAAAIKALPLTLKAARPLHEAISSAGGVTCEALDKRLMLKALPGVFCAGEMVDWEAPTGGYLLTACFASGRTAGAGALAWLAERAERAKS